MSSLPTGRTSRRPRGALLPPAPHLTNANTEQPLGQQQEGPEPKAQLFTQTEEASERRAQQRRKQRETLPPTQMSAAGRDNQAAHLERSQRQQNLGKSRGGQEKRHLGTNGIRRLP